MNILAIDTALADVSAVAWRTGGELVACSFRHERDALQRLSGLVGQVLERSDLEPGELDVIGCASGPGSFTGLRVGLAAAKAMADCCGARMVGVSTLELLAMRVECPAGQAAATIIESCPGELYCGLYRRACSGVEEMVSDSVVDADGFQDWLRSALSGTGLVGVGGPAVGKYGRWLTGLPVVADADSIQPMHLMDVVRKRAESGRSCGALDLQATYLRASQAEVRRAALVEKQA